MNSVATYQVLRDTSVSLERFALVEAPDNELVLPFTWPENMVTGDITRRALFSTRLILETSIRWSVFLDSTAIIDGLFHTGSQVISIQEVIDLSPFAQGRVPGEEVPITIRVTSGSARFSDVIIWYHTEPAESAFQPLRR